MLEINKSRMIYREALSCIMQPTRLQDVNLCVSVYLFMKKMEVAVTGITAIRQEKEKRDPVHSNFFPV
jgi:hypothetical protein